MVLKIIGDTHTHTHTERERERERSKDSKFLKIAQRQPKLLLPACFLGAKINNSFSFFATIN
jgi:hypothetical protein